MPSLPQDSPAAGLGTGFPLVRGPPSDLMGFYVTSYEAAFGKRPSGSPQKRKWRVLGVQPPCDRGIRPLLGIHSGSGYVANNYSALSKLVSPYVERQDTDVSTTAEDFKLFGHPEFQRMLPECVDERECRYPADFSFSRLRFEEARAPKASREYGTSPAQPDVPQRMTELSGFTGTTPRSDILSEQPLDGSVDRMGSFPSTCSPPKPAMGHPAPFTPLELQVGPKGVTTRKEPSSYSTVHNQYLTELSPLAPVAPGWWSQGPITWVPRSVDGIQTPRPSGFSTNNHPTNLWHIEDPVM